MTPADHPLLRSLPLFAGDPPPRIVELRDEFDRAWAAYSNAVREELVLTDIAWGDPEMLGPLVPRIIELRRTIRESWRAMGDAVDVAETIRRARLFADGEPPLGALRTLAAIRDGSADLDALQTPLTDADRARIRARRRRS